jgi:hypothetical protein
VRNGESLKERKLKDKWKNINKETRKETATKKKIKTGYGIKVSYCQGLSS